MAAGIYAITNKVNGKAYISAALNFGVRWNRHRSDLRLSRHHNLYLQRSWNKYGEEAFKFGILEYLDNLDELYLAEQFWVDTYKEENKELYNMATPGKAPMLGFPVSKETCRKISKGLKGKPKSEEHKRKLSEANKGQIPWNRGKKHTKEARWKMSQAQMGNTKTLGHTLSEEHIHKIIEANAKSYPAFIHRETGEIIPAGRNLTALCRERKLDIPNMWHVAHGGARSHKGWVLAESLEVQ